MAAQIAKLLWPRSSRHQIYSTYSVEWSHLVGPFLLVAPWPDVSQEQTKQTRTGQKVVYSVPSFQVVCGLDEGTWWILLSGWEKCKVWSGFPYLKSSDSKSHSSHNHSVVLYQLHYPVNAAISHEVLEEKQQVLVKNCSSKLKIILQTCTKFN